MVFYFSSFANHRWMLRLINDRTKVLQCTGIHSIDAYLSLHSNIVSHFKWQQSSSRAIVVICTTTIADNHRTAHCCLHDSTCVRRHPRREWWMMYNNFCFFFNIRFSPKREQWQLRTNCCRCRDTYMCQLSQSVVGISIGNNWKHLWHCWKTMTSETVRFGVALKSIIN